MNTPEQRLAYKELWRAKKEGRWHGGSECVTCGSTAFLHEHHDDYAKPLETVCLCAACHKGLHLDRKAAELSALLDLLSRQKEKP